MSYCQYAKKCSGCQLQNLNYKEQLQMKQVKLIRLLGKYAHVNEIIGMENPFHYRNKAQSAFFVKNGKITSGIYQSSTQKIVSVDSCLLEDEASDKIISTIRRLCPKFKIKPYDAVKGTGFLRHILVRKGFKTNEIMVVIVSSVGEFRGATSFVNELLRLHPEITTVVHNINDTSTPLFLGEKSYVLYGEGYIKDELCGLTFRISPKSFYQINPTQTERLYQTAREYASLKGEETVIDAYCGTGTIGLTMAQNARKVIGVEVNKEAVLDAKENARINKIENVEFINEDAGKYMQKLAIKGQSVDVVVTDPPRAGCSKQFIDSLISMSPKRIVYISCNPETLARDLNILVRNKYKITKIQPVDMFPHTNHTEVVVGLRKI